MVSPQERSQDLTTAATCGEIISAAQAVIQQLQNLVATAAGDASISANGASTQLSALITQFQTAVGDKVTTPLNSLGYDIQNLGQRIIFATNNLNEILTRQRNCAYANAASLESGIRNVGLSIGANIPFVASGAPRIDLFQFVGHDPMEVPAEGGDLLIKGYRLYVGKAPLISLVTDSGALIAKLSASKAGSQDEVSTAIPGATLTANAGKTLAFKLEIYVPKTVIGFIPAGNQTAELNLPFVVPKAYALSYQVTAQVTYYTATPENVNLQSVSFDFHNASCEDRHNLPGDTRTPQLPSGPRISDAQITGYHFANWPDGHASPNTRNQSSIAVTTTATTVSAAGWLDTASCVQEGFIVHVARLLHDTFWQAVVVPEARYTEEKETSVSSAPVTAVAVLPETTAILTFPTASAEAGVKSFSYSVVPVVNGVAQKALYQSPVVSGNERGVDDAVSLGPVSITAHWNPQPVNGMTQVTVKISEPTCGY
jgi:hypothetical protein